MLVIEGDSKIECIPNYVQRLSIYLYDSFLNVNTNPPLCNPTNNINHCQSYPVMQGTIYYDNNNNGIKDAGEPFKKNMQITLSNGSFGFSNI